MTRTQWMVVTVGVLCVIGASYPSSFAAEGHGQMMHGGHDQEEQEDHSAHYLTHLLKHAKDIGLTPEQIGKLKALQLEFKRTEARLEADVKIAKLDLQALLEDEKADLLAMFQQMREVMRAMIVLFLLVVADMHHLSMALGGKAGRIRCSDHTQNSKCDNHPLRPRHETHLHSESRGF